MTNIHKRPLPHPSVISLEELTAYAIVDCAHFDHKFYREIRNNPNLTAKSLFADTRDEESTFAGPILIQIHPETTQTLILQAEQDKPSVVWLWSNETFNPLFRNLQFLLRGKQENGQPIFCRYYDPRCLQTYLKLYEIHQELSKKTESIKCWAYWDVTLSEYTYLYNKGDNTL